MMAGEIYRCFEENVLTEEEQKGCITGYKRKSDHSMLYKYFLKYCKYETYALVTENFTL